MIDLSDSCLTPLEKEQFYDLLEKYKKAFSLRDEIGLAHGMQITLELTDTTLLGYHADTPITIKAEASRKADSRIH